MVRRLPHLLVATPSRAARNSSGLLWAEVGSSSTRMHFPRVGEPLGRVEEWGGEEEEEELRRRGGVEAVQTWRGCHTWPP